MTFTIHGKEVILLGDTTTHGGKVVTASAGASYMGRPIARVGDSVTCPKCSGTHTIVEGAPTAFDVGQQIACHGDKVSCGATLISSQSPGSTMAAGTFGVRENVAPKERKHTAEELCAAIASVMQSENVQRMLREAQRLTGETGHEYGGWIVETSPGVYEIPELHTTGEAMHVDAGDAPEGTIGFFHTHTEQGMPSFSYDDRDWADKKQGLFDIVLTYAGVVYQDRTGNNIVCDPNLGGPRICDYSGDDESNPNKEDPGCW